MTEPSGDLRGDEEVNPYQSPGWLDAEAPYSYYKIDSRKVRYAEYWRLLPNPFAFLVAAGLKLLRVPVGLGGGWIYPVQLTRLTADELPSHAHDALRASIARWEEQRFRLVLYDTIATLGDQENYTATLLGEDGLVVSQATYVRVTPASGKTEERTVNSCLSKFSDGRFLVTTAAEKELNPPPQFDRASLPGGTIAEILEHHRGRLDKIRERPIAFEDSQLEDLRRQLDNIQMEYFLDRGLDVPMTPKEVAKAGPPRNLRP